METSRATSTGIHRVQRSTPAFDEKKFFPSGAIAFFILLVVLGLIIWFGIYFLMIQRS